MKKLLYILLIAAVAFTACKKGDLVESTQYTKINVGDPAYSFLRFYDASPGSPSINYYLNGTRVTGGYNALSGETGFAYSGIFPVLGGQYIPITPGTSAITGKIVSSAAIDPNLQVFNTSINTAGGKYYTLFSTGAYSTTSKTIPSSLLLEEAKPILDTTKVFVRLVNLYSGAPANIDMVQKTTGQVIISNVAYNSASGFVEIPLPGQTNVYQFNNTGTTTPTSATTLSAILTKGQAYTIVLRGVSGSTTFPFAIGTPTVSFY